MSQHELSVRTSQSIAESPPARAAQPAGEAPPATGGGIRKSAVLLLSLDPHQAQEILSRLPADAVRAVRDEMASLRRVDAVERDEVVGAYRRELLAHGPAETARPLPAPIPSVETQTADSLYGCSPQVIFETLCEEHPQCIAAVLASLPVDKAGQCLGRLTIRTQIEVIRRLASLRPVDPSILEEICITIRSRARQLAARHAPCPVLKSVLDNADKAEREEPADDQSSSRHVFEDLLRLDERGLRLVLEETDKSALGLAISTVSKRFRRRVLGMLSKPVAVEVRQAAAARPLYLSDIESAQERILRIVHRLKAAGEIALTAGSPPAAAPAFGSAGQLMRKGA